MRSRSGNPALRAVAARWIEKQQPLRGQADPHSLPRPDRTVAGDPGDEALAATSTRHGVGFRLWTFGSGAVLELRSVGMIRASTVIATRGREPKAVSQEPDAESYGRRSVSSTGAPSIASANEPVQLNRDGAGR